MSIFMLLPCFFLQIEVCMYFIPRNVIFNVYSSQRKNQQVQSERQTDRQKHITHSSTRVDTGFDKAGGPWRACGAQAYHRGLGAKPLAVSRGTAPGGGSGGRRKGQKFSI